MEKLENYRPSEAANFLRISRSQFFNLVKDGTIKTIKLSKQVTIVRRSELESFLDKASEEA